MESQDIYYEIAKQILVDIGAIAYCDAHEDYFYLKNLMYDEKEVYAKATIKFKEIYPKDNILMNFIAQ